MRLTSFYTVLGCAVAFLLTSSLMVEQCSAIRVHTVGVSATSAAEAGGFARRLTADGTVEPTPDQAASRIFKVSGILERITRQQGECAPMDAIARQHPSCSKPSVQCTLKTVLDRISISCSVLDTFSVRSIHHPGSRCAIKLS